LGRRSGPDDGRRAFPRHPIEKLRGHGFSYAVTDSRWGWEIVRRGELSEWDERSRHNPLMGTVRIRAQRVWPSGGYVSFSVKEWWGRPPLDGPERQQGFVLAGYHYTASSSRRQVWHCYDTIRHPDAHSMCIRAGITSRSLSHRSRVEQALAAFEQRLAEELNREAPAVSGDEDRRRRVRRRRG
jgi:hypothetical protein